MSPRYVLVVDQNSAGRRQLVERLSRRTGLKPAFENASLAVLATPACTCVAVGSSGCVLGTLFRRHGPAQQLTALTSADITTIADSDSAVLRSFWGGYVSALARADGVSVVRDPSGTFPCYFANLAGAHVLASDAELVAAVHIAPPAIDYEEIGRQFYRAFVPVPATALCGIRELLPGFALRISSERSEAQPCWSPWEHINDPRVTEPSPQSFFQTLVHCVQCWGSTHKRFLLSVSGGLDSSIVATCLARAGSDTICLTMFTEDAGGDERPFARALCERLRLPLIERPYRLEDIDLTEALAPELPRPRDRTQANAYERIHLQVAAESRAAAFVTGNGGDSVLGYSQSAAAVADRYLSQGLGQELFASLVDVCRQTGCSMFDAIRQGWRIAHGPRAYQLRPNPLFLDADFIGSIAGADIAHPWLLAPAEALPGKSAHIASILRVQPNIEASRGRYLPLLTPLMSQPIIEACLKVPSWEWRAGGRDRSFARRAFAQHLPPAILNRRVKGSPSHFAGRLLDHFRTRIRERLLEGLLARHKIIDRVAVEQALVGERPVPDLERVRILELVNAEAWIDHWEARRQARTPV